MVDGLGNIVKNAERLPLADCAFGHVLRRLLRPLVLLALDELAQIEKVKIARIDRAFKQLFAHQDDQVFIFDHGDQILESVVCQTDLKLITLNNMTPCNLTPL